MTEIIPAVLEKNYTEVVRRLDQVAGIVKTVQIDICDGVFVPSITWPFISPAQYDKTLNLDKGYRSIVEGEYEMPHWQDFDFELDLMVADSKALLPDLMTLGPARVLFHAEAFTDLYNEVEACCALLPTIVEPGIAINADTNPEILFELLDAGIITSVQCMGIAKIGYQGQPFDERVLKNLEILRARYPHLPLGVDGSVTLETAPRLVKAGANRLASGSGIFAAPDITARIGEFKKILE
jgi:ribulose-phosphate 3-epimerase